jgi:hypothetical protein
LNPLFVHFGSWLLKNHESECRNITCGFFGLLIDELYHDVRVCVDAVHTLLVNLHHYLHALEHSVRDWSKVFRNSGQQRARTDGLWQASEFGQQDLGGRESRDHSGESDHVQARLWGPGLSQSVG